MDQDILYHLALGSGSHNLEEMFGDVKVRFFHKSPREYRAKIVDFKRKQKSKQFDEKNVRQYF